MFYVWKAIKSRKGEDVIESLFAFFLANLGVKDTDEINQWFRDSYADKYEVEGFDKVREILEGNPDLPVYIFGDYDVDGRCATAILTLGLTQYGRIVHYRVPKRISEGFGLNLNMVNEIEEDKAIIITCDNGIAAIEAVAEAKRRGHIVIVTDHHSPVIENGAVVYPDADVIIDPNAVPDSAVFNGYCGAGIAYKLVRYLAGKNRTKLLLPFAAVATICDSVPLREENYVFVRNGLRMIENRKAPAGILALIDEMHVENVTSDAVGFRIGPPINAPGRLYDEDGITLPLLTTDDYKFAKILAAQVREVNEERKKIKAAGLEDALAYITENNIENDPVLVLKLHVKEGIIGILAGELLERYKRPAIVFTDAFSDEPEQVLLKGSARSIDGIDIKAVLDENAKFIFKYGGHPGAAGVSILTRQFDAFRKGVNKTVKPLLKIAKADVREYVAEIRTEQIEDVLELQEKFGPFGEANRKPVYKVTDFDVLTFRKDLSANGVKFTSRNGCEAVGFGMREAFDGVERPISMNFYGTLSYNVFRGNRTMQINFIDFDIVTCDNETELARTLRTLNT